MNHDLLKTLFLNKLDKDKPFVIGKESFNEIQNLFRGICSQPESSKWLPQYLIASKF